jgi:uncharacterized protein GlcG (DUF336 family)
MQGDQDAGLTAQRVVLTLEGARRIAAAAEAEARRQGWNVCIAVVDEAGRLIHFIRMDDTQPASDEIAIGKGRAAAVFRRPSRVLEEGIASRPALIAFPAIPVTGGLPITAGGRVIGGIGVSGVQSQQDEIVARAGADLLE